MTFTENSNKHVIEIYIYLAANHKVKYKNYFR